MGLWFKDFVLCTINNPQRNGQGVTGVGLLQDGNQEPKVMKAQAVPSPSRSVTAGDRNGETSRSGRTPSIMETEAHF